MTGQSSSGVAGAAPERRPAPGCVDADAVMAAELDYLRQRRAAGGSEAGAAEPRDSLAGLALSGGGIRSASFSLGVMQALARYGWMARFDYLSTVSGGGYIGTCLSWLLAQRDGTGDPVFGVQPGNFPFGTRRPQATVSATGADAGTAATTRTMSDMLYWLRQHASYLMPGRGIDLASLAAVVIGNALASLAFFFPLLCAGIWVVRVLREWLEGVPLLYGPAAPLEAAPALINLAAWLAALFALLAVLYAGASVIGWGESVHGATGSGVSAYATRRGYARAMGGLLLCIVCVVLVGTVYPVAQWLDQLPQHIEALWGDPRGLPGGAGRGWFSALTGLLASVLGAIPALRTHLAGGKRRGAGGRSWVGPLAALLMIYGLLLLANDAVRHLATGETVAGMGAAGWVPLGLLLVVGVGLLADLNGVSMHRYYRDRLMETFMPALAPHGAVAAGGRVSDRAFLHDMLDTGRPGAPYHLINTNAVLVDADEPRCRGRGGDSFVLSPLYCGSDATGYRASADFMGGSVTLASAMAASGAALNPNAGVGGSGVTRDRAVSFLLRLLNARLGYWVRNPRDGVTKFKRPHYLWTGLFALFGIGFREKSHYIELSDGGHFENLALYELIRRRCRVIVVVDGGADPGYSFEDLANAVERVRVDFGASIDLRRSQLEQMVPRKASGADPGCTDEPRPCMAGTAFVVAKIKYADDSEGRLVYLNTTLADPLWADVYGYKLAHDAFPDEPTSDQFFDETQFEAYRELGYCVAEAVVELRGTTRDPLITAAFPVR